VKGLLFGRWEFFSHLFLFPFLFSPRLLVGRPSVCYGFYWSSLDTCST